MTQDSPGRYYFANVSEEDLATTNRGPSVLIIEESVIGEDEPTIEIERPKKTSIITNSHRSTRPIGKR